MACTLLGLGALGPAPLTSSASPQRAGSATIHPNLRIAPSDQQLDGSVSAKQRRAAWARLIKKVYDADPLTCSRCGKPMKVLAVITEPTQVFKILRHLITIAKPPPDLDPASLN